MTFWQTSGSRFRDIGTRGRPAFDQDFVSGAGLRPPFFRQFLARSDRDRQVVGGL
jgi:hypothetical protein